MPNYVQDRLNIYDAVLLLQGLGNTVLLCVCGLGLGLVIALFVGLARASRSCWLSWPAAAYIEIIRDSPLLMQLYLIFFALPLMGLQVPIFAAGVATLMVNSSAFMAEIVRAGIQAVGRDQWDAARGLGMGYVHTMRHVVMPQAFRVMIPPGVGLLIGLIKDSSIISVISYIELTRVGQILTEKTFLSFQVFGIVAALYFILCYPLSRLALHAERRLKAGG
ncbi:MAG: amino acid ABC transporter permease [Zetaproteobacteria bacterium]|jgi:His/Glu/Gln/Arg/opine family amino acid ABC transporter permease subunit|nr:MAG: amino acid ABC transporter permease [Zetaproteobacteria bacterium]